VKLQWILEMKGLNMANVTLSLEKLEENLPVPLASFLESNASKQINIVFVDFYESSPAFYSAMKHNNSL
jgi:hypothetical protein